MNSSHRSLLPESLTPFIGRDAELRELASLVRRTRLLTLTGSGGSGKTRVAMEVARLCLQEASDSVRWAELAPLVSGDLIASHLATQLGIRERPDRAIVDVLAMALQPPVSLLVLDNCEHIVDAAAQLVETLLRRCPHLNILATSREALGVDGERAWLLRGLNTMPDAPGAEGSSEAVRFFLDRVQAINQSSRLTPASLGAVEKICRRLDGMPLALELAAARVAVLTPEQIADRLDDAFRLLTSGRRTALPRHQTLAAAVAWSYRLISAAEQELLQRLSVFSGTFSLDAAEQVCSGDGLEVDDILDLLAGLVRRSLVNVLDGHDMARYSLLEIIRQFAAEQRPDGGALAQRHAEYYAGFARQGLVLLEETHSRRNLDRLTTEYPNLRAALLWAYKGGDPQVGHRLCAALWWYWGMTWQLSEWRFWVEESLRHPSAADDAVWGHAVHGAGTLEYITGNLLRGRQLLEQSIRVLEAGGDRCHASMAHTSLCNLLLNDGQVEAAQLVGEKAVAIARELDEPLPFSHAMCNGLGMVLVRQGRLDQASACLDEAHRMAKRFDHTWSLVSVARARAGLALDQGDAGTASRCILEALPILLSINHPHTGFRYVLVLGRVLAARGDPQEAARICGTISAALDRGMVLLREEERDLEQLLADLRDRIGAAVLESLREEGRGESLEQALARGHEVLSRPSHPGRHAASRTGRLELRFESLGVPRITIGGTARLAQGRQSRAVELLAFLLADPEGRTRDEVGAVFWPEASPTQVKNNFHVALHKLRRGLGAEEIIVTQGEHYRLHPEASLWFDAREFEQALGPALRPGRTAEARSLETGLGLYRGDFLAGETLSEWGNEFRERLRNRYLDALGLLADARQRAGDVAGAAAVLEDLLQADDLREAACRMLMSCLDAMGMRDMALQHYRRLESRLRSELGVAPDPLTQELAARLRRSPTG